VDIEMSYRTYTEADIPVLLEQWVTTIHGRPWPRWLYDDGCECEGGHEYELVLKQLMHNKHDALDSDDDESMSLPNDPCICMSLLRLRFGELVEEDINRRWDANHDDSCRLRYASISLAAAVWTSTHAEFLLARSTEHTYLDRATIHLVPSEYIDPQLSDFLTSMTSINECGNGIKRAQLVYQLLHRSENTANRGWKSSSQQLLQLKGPNGAGLRDIVLDAAMVTLTGLHSCIDPPYRLNWRERLRIHHTFRGQFDTADVIETAPNFIKQVVRRLLLSTYVGNDVARTVHNTRRRTEGAFGAPPFKIASRRCRHLMAIITSEAASKGVPEFIRTIDKLADITHQRMWVGSEEWPWNGKAGTSQTPVMLKPVALSMYMQAHNANFAPFWTICYNHQMRISRLDKAQYDGFCEMNQIIELARNQKKAVKMALEMPYGHKISLEQVLELFGQSRANVTSSSYKKVLQDLPIETLSSILAFARVSEYLEHIQKYDYAPNIQKCQELAVYERYIGPGGALDLSSIQEGLAKLPEHAYKLCICTECHRVTNAHATRNNNIDNHIAPFNEIGLASCITCATDVSNVRCAKRISAAIRTSIADEHIASKNAIDIQDMVWDDEFEASADTELSRVESGHLRRDARRTYEQLRESKACGQNQLLCIPLMGKLVRACDTWYALCCYCGSLIANVNSDANVNGYPACMRCGELKIIKKEKKTPAATDHICRFCRYHKKDLTPYFSPFDDQFENKHIPEELRVTFWCSKHRPSWLPEALMSGRYDDACIIPMGEIVARIGQHLAPF